MRQDLTGQTIGNYQIEQLLGTGGMGQVYRAVHRMLDRPAAVKVMHPHLAVDPGFQARFLREAQAAANLDHPNIIRLYDFGEHDGLYYMVMELLPDGSLRSLLPSHAGGRAPSLPVCLNLVRQTADGLHYAHGRGMIHRDIKPDNVLLKRDPGAATTGGSLVAVISDFGLARLREGSSLTASGVAMGTPAYMSPEQFQAIELDGRSDIYSLGVVLYEVATGYLPFEARTISDAGYKHVHTEPARPRDVNPQLSEPIEAIILRCLAKNPAERFATAGDLADALRQVIDERATDLFIPGRVTEIPDSPDAATTPKPAVDASSGELPPYLPTLAGGSDMHRIQVLSSSGRALHLAELTGEGLTLGRSAENDITLPDTTISRHHLRIDWDGDRVRVTDLGSSSGTVIGEHRLPPNFGQTWEPGSWLRAGPYWLWLQSPAAAPRAAEHSMPIVAPVAGDAGSSFSGGVDRLRVLIEDDELTITPGRPEPFEIMLANLGRTVDHLRLSIEGVPSSWADLPDEEVRLNPGDHTRVRLRVEVDRVPGNHAGEYVVTLRARSRSNPDESAVANARWHVMPFRGSALELTPSRASTRDRALFHAELSNSGNAPERFILDAEDERRSLRYRFADTGVAVEPGARVAVPIEVGAPRRTFGGVRAHPFTVRARVDSGGTHTAHGQLAHRAALPIWALPVIAIALFATCVSAAVFGPGIVDGLRAGEERVTPPAITAVQIPDTPVNLTVVPSLTQIEVSWQHNNQNIERFEVQRAVDTGPFEPVGEVQALAFREQLTDIPGNRPSIVRVTYRVRAVTPDGVPSEFSEERSVEVALFPR
jgi:eukaryotic-like serine/threonine-protein kinase